MRNAQFKRSFLVTIALLVILFITVPVLALAQIKVRSEISPASGTTNDMYVFSVIIEGVQNAPPPLLSGGNDFSLQLLGPQTNLTIVNGDINARIAYLYRLTPRREGDLLTPTAEVDVNGTVYTAAPIKVAVKQEATAGGGNDVVERGGNLFMQQALTPARVYQGQQVVNSVTVFTRVELQDPQLDDLTTDGFWQESISDDDRSTKEVNRVNYTAVEIRKALFPLKSGSLTVPARKLTAKIPDRRRPAGFPDLDPFDSGFFDNFFGAVPTRPVSVTSNEVKLEVKPLPPPPSNIAPLLGSVPLVGATAVKVDYSADVLKVGESKTVTVEVFTEGNINPLKSLPLQTGSDIKVYDERPETKSDMRGSRVVMHRYFKYSIVPLRGGLIRIPGVKVAYFDPQKENYEIATSPDIAIAVEGDPTNHSAVNTGTGSAVSNPQHPGSAPTVDTTQNIPPPLRYEEPTLSDRLSRLISIQLSILILASVIAVGIVIYLFTVGPKKPKMKGISAASVRDADSVRELHSIMRQLLTTRFGSQVQSLSLDEIRAFTTKELKEKETALAINSLLDDFEVLMYGNRTGDQNEAMAGLKRRMEEVVNRW